MNKENKSKKVKRFFFHFRKSTGELTLHFNKQCIPIKDIVCLVPVETKWNKIQPRVVLRGFCSDVVVDSNGRATIS